MVCGETQRALPGGFFNEHIRVQRDITKARFGRRCGDGYAACRQIGVDVAVGDDRTAQRRTRVARYRCAGVLHPRCGARGTVRDADVRRIQQPRPRRSIRRPRVNARAAGVQCLFARGLHQAALAAQGAALGRNLRRHRGAVVGPHHHGAAVAFARRVGAEFGTCGHGGGLCVADPAVLALVAAADQHFAAAAFAAGVYGRRAAHIDRRAADLHRAALAGAAQCRDAAVHTGIGQRLEDHLAAFDRDRGGVDETAVLERAGKNADRVAAQVAQVDRAVRWRLHLQLYAFEAAPGQRNLLARRQNGAAVGGLDQGVLAGLDTGAKQHHVAAARQNAAVDRKRTGAAGRAKAKTPGQGIGVAHGQCRGREAGRVDHGVLAHHDAGLVHQNQVAVAAEGSENLAGRVGDDAVDGRAGSRGLQEIGGLPRTDGKALPVDGRESARSAVLRRDREFVALVVEGGLPHHDSAPGGVGHRDRHRSTPSQGHGERECADSMPRCIANQGLTAAAGAAAGLAPPAGYFCHRHHGAKRLVPYRSVDMVERCASRHVSSDISD